MSTPPPGSPEAVERGCLCAVLDNFHGEGIPWRDGRRWWVSDDCPLHGHGSAWQTGEEIEEGEE